MNFLEKNIAALRRRDPSLAERIEEAEPGDRIVVEPARQGGLTARVGDICIHSPYNPAREAMEWSRQQAERFAPPPPLTVVGFGLGHHVAALAAEGFGGTVIEDDPAMLRVAFSHTDLTTVIERFSFLAGIPEDVIRRRHDRLLKGNVAVHPGAARVTDSLGRLGRYAEGLDLAARGGLRILLVNPICGGSLPAAHHCARALRSLGHEVIPFASETFAAGMEFAKEFRYNQSRRAFNTGLANLLSQAVEIRAREVRPDMVLALAQAPLMPETMQRLATRGIPTAFWFVEDYRVLPYWRESAPASSWFFGIQKENFAAELAKIGVTRYSYLPTCAAPDVHRPVELTAAEREEFGSPLSFVGAGYFNRQVFFKGLTDYPFKIWGSDWPLISPLSPWLQRRGARIDTETSVKIFNASPVNLNLHSSTTCDGVVPDGDFVNPRTFEIAACGAFQLVDRRRLLPELFEADEMETFSELAEVREKIDRSLRDEEGRRAVVERGRRRVLAEHTYERRMEELVATMVAEFPQVAERVRKRIERRETVETEQERHPGLAEILATVPDRRWFTMGNILGGIVTGEGNLSRAEKIFLMLQNVEILWEKIPE
ncbi:glycosyltransferase [Geobacter pickeringii]|uniref:glycosyltransferase n=1 Tax=Geobacter pickeringii TaxID=345632 RepID=UPI001F2A60AD|nr:glycosyltransferase [Geobacter pickeringii]